MLSWLSTSAQRKRALLTLILLVVMTAFLATAWTALLPFFLGAMMAYLLLPVVNFFDSHSPRFLRRIHWSRPMAILLVYIVVIAIIAGIIAYFVPVVRSQSQVFAQEVLPNYFQRIQRIFTFDFGALLAQIPPEIQATVNASLDKAVATLLAGVQKGIEVTIATVSQTISFFFGMIIIPFWVFYVLNDDAKIRSSIKNLIPETAREDVSCIVALVDDLLGAYVRGQILLCLILGLMAIIVLLILQVDLAVLLGTFVGIFEIIPIVGPYLGALPAVLIALLKQPILAVWVILAFMGIQQIEHIFLAPRITGGAVRFHPALVMVILVVGSQVAGLLGVLVAVPVAAVIRDVSRYLYLRTTEQGATPQMALERMRFRSA
jgi:predicted PurR-regulated permease PerM